MNLLQKNLGVLGRGFKTQGYRDLILSHNPVAYWRLGETSGVIVKDETGNHHGKYLPNDNGVWNGGIMGIEGAIKADGNTCVQFEGSGEAPAAGVGAIQIPAAGAFDGEWNFSGEFWLYRISALSSLIFNKDRSPGGWSFRIQDINKGVRFTYWQVADYEILASLPLNDWLHVAITVDELGILRVYVNAILTDDPIQTDQPILSPNPFFIRKSSSGSASVSPVIIDEPAIYNYALTPTQIQQHYNKGVSG